MTTRPDCRRSATARVAPRLFRLLEETARIKSPRVYCDRAAVFIGLFIPSLSSFCVPTTPVPVERRRMGKKCRVRQQLRS